MTASDTQPLTPAGAHIPHTLPEQAFTPRRLGQTPRLAPRPTKPVHHILTHRSQNPRQTAPCPVPANAAQPRLARSMRRARPRQGRGAHRHHSARCLCQHWRWCWCWFQLHSCCWHLRLHGHFSMCWRGCAFVGKVCHPQPHRALLSTQ